MKAHSSLRLEVGQDVDDGDLLIAVAVLARASKVRVDYGRPIADMGMCEHADTAIVTAEYKQQHRRRIFPYMSHSLKIERQI